MKTSTFVSLLALATSTLAFPQWEGFGGGGGSGSSTQNDVTNKAPCKAITIIFARGTSETGNVGSVAGPPFFKALQSSVGADKVAVQGVTYAANWNGAFAGGDAAGSKTMASLVGQAIQQCPSTKVVLSGYSQGAQLVHNAAKQISAAQTSAVSSVVVFGDPNNGQAVGSVPAFKVKSFCAAGDSVCRGGGGAGAGGNAHLSYGKNANEAAAFVKQAAGL